MNAYISIHSLQLTVAKVSFQMFIFYFSAASAWESRGLALTDNKAGVLFSHFRIYYYTNVQIYYKENISILFKTT
jgi:hypothetical protein